MSDARGEAPDGQGEQSRGGDGGDRAHAADAPNAPLHRRILDGAERDRLRVLRAATEEGAPRYLAILSVFVAARDRYEVEVRTDRLASDLAEIGVEIDNLDQALNQLKEWGNLTWTQDTTRVARLEDFRRRQALWHLTAGGQAAYDAVIAVLSASDQQGSLQRTLFREIRDNLALLGTAVDEGDAEQVYLRLRDLDGSLHDLASNARDFHASVALLRREHDVDPARFLAYKELLIAYLDQFLDHLVAQREQVAAAVGDISARGLDRLVALAAAGDDSTGLFATDDRATVWRERWEGLAAWFVATPGRASGADELEAATTGAIRDLLALLRRVTESARRPITRASELVVLARWFRRLPDDAASAELFDAAFGLGRPLHLAGEDDDGDQVPSTTTWWDAPPVPVPVTLREHGKRPGPGRPTAAVDYGATKARLAAEHRAAQEARAQAAARLCARPIEGRVLSDPELAVMFELLDRAAHQRPVGEVAGNDTPISLEGATAALVVDPRGMVVQTRRGTLTLEGHRLVIEPLVVERQGSSR
jgi:uncharacterized protein (TIGR02677 family)